MKASRNGKVRVVYQQYQDEFEISEGSLTAAAIDEEYCLSDVMPRCQLHLSRISPAEYTRLCQDGEFGPDFELKYEREEPWGTFQDLNSGRSCYYLWVVQDEAAQEAERARMAGAWERERAAVLASEEEGAARTEESCSCVEGNPCVDPYICLDWHNRISVAKRHGYVAGAATRLF